MGITSVQSGIAALSVLKARVGADGAEAWVTATARPRDLDALLQQAAARRDHPAGPAQAATGLPDAGKPPEGHRGHRGHGEAQRLLRRMEAWSAGLKRLLAGGTIPPGTTIVSLIASRGPDAVAIRADMVLGLATGGGSDAVTIEADVVAGVTTDEPTRHDHGPDGDGAGYSDAIAISARIAEGVATGGGNDAVAIRADRVGSVHAGDGQDGVAISAGMVGGVYGGNGADAITVNAAFGQAASHQIASMADWQLALAGDAAGRFQLALSTIADINGDGGNDAIAIAGAQLISVDGGEGDDLISLSGQTVALHFGRNGGHDVVQLGAGTEVVLQLDREISDYTVTTDGDRMVVEMGDAGRVTFVGIAKAGAIGISAGMHPVQFLQTGPLAALDLLV